MITTNGDKIPDEMLIGMVRSEWPIHLLYDNLEQAADWLSRDARNRRVYRVRLTPIEEMAYVPPVMASLEAKSITGYADDGSRL
jgi:hypothetical protein